MTGRRLLIVGDERFAVDAVELLVSGIGGFGALGVVGADADITEEVRQFAPDLVVVDGVSDVRRGLDWVPCVRSAAGAALVLLVADDLECALAVRDIDDAVIVVARPARMPRRTDAPRISGRPRPPVSAAAAAASAAGAVPAADANRLTSRELETLRWVVAGQMNAGIARRLWVTEQTVKFHLTNVYRKLGVANRTEASRYAIEHGLVRMGDARSADADVEEPASVVSG